MDTNISIIQLDWVLKEKFNWEVYKLSILT